MASTDIIKVAVISLPNQSVYRAHPPVAGPVEGVADESVGCCGHAQGVGQDDGRFKITQFMHLRGSCQLAEAIAYIYGGRHFLLE